MNIPAIGFTSSHKQEHTLSQWLKSTSVTLGVVENNRYRSHGDHYKIFARQFIIIGIKIA